MRMLTTFSTPRAWPVRSLSSELMGDMLNEFDSVVDSFLQPTYARTVNFQPSCEINETDDHYLIGFDMPGVKKEDIKIEVKNRQLHVWGERRRVTANEEGGVESADKFERIFSLPEAVDTEKIEASYENGVLNVALPKAETAKPKVIEIQSGTTGFWGKLISSKNETKEAKTIGSS